MTMSRSRFEQISATIRFDDRLTRPRRQRRDRLAAVRELWDQWQNRLALLYNCGKEVRIIMMIIIIIIIMTMMMMIMMMMILKPNERLMVAIGLTLKWI